MMKIKIEKTKNFIINFLSKNIGFIKFCIVGASNTALSLIIYWILNNLGIIYLLSSTISYFVGILNGYMLSTRFVFKSSRNMHTGIRFFIVYGISLFINLLILYLMVDCIGLDKMIGQIVATGVNTLFNYFANKVWTFRVISNQ